MKLAVVLVHGIGNYRKNWASKIIPTIENRLKLKLKNILGSEAPKNIGDVVVISRTYWEGVFKDRERKLRNKFDGFPKPTKAGGPWWDEIGKYIWRPFKRFQNEIIADFIGDIIGYLHKDAQRAVYKKISDTLKGCCSRVKEDGDKIPLTFIAHSLGSVMTSDYIYEQNNPLSDTSGPKIMKDHFILDNFFTVGSPLSLFSLRFGGPEAFIKPISIESPQGRWVNIVDEDDPVGMPLKVLNDAYNKVILKDVIINSGVYGISHLGYFKKSSKALDIICQKLAIDWIALNQKLPKEEIDKLYEDYDKTLGVLN
ncbi:MAG: hypothetical protein HYZ44_18210 [Bacteroidetes bacterium]|nr:hypothetical protein [Bacteroidota bacterium]